MVLIAGTGLGLVSTSRWVRNVHACSCADTAARWQLELADVRLLQGAGNLVGEKARWPDKAVYNYSNKTGDLYPAGDPNAVPLAEVKIP